MAIISMTRSMIFKKDCPMCGLPLIRESEDQGYGNDGPSIYCTKTVKMDGSRKVFNHYREEDFGLNKVVMIVPPYRITTSISTYSGLAYSYVGTYMRYKTGKKGYYFKTILKLDSEIHPDVDNKVLSRVKLLLLMS
jgi:hypothetical protein